MTTKPDNAPEPKEPDVVPLDDPTVPYSLVPVGEGSDREGTRVAPLKAGVAPTGSTASHNEPIVTTAKRTERTTPVEELILRDLTSRIFYAMSGVESLVKSARLLQEDSEILRRSNIIEIAVRNETGSVSEYMNHWEGRALKAEAEIERVRAAAAPQPQPEDQGARVEPLNAGVGGQDLSQSGSDVVVIAAERTARTVRGACKNCINWNASIELHRGRAVCAVCKSYNVFAAMREVSELDNHHNAASCPYCNFGVRGAVPASPWPKTYPLSTHLTNPRCRVHDPGYGQCDRDEGHAGGHWYHGLFARLTAAEAERHQKQWCPICGRADVGDLLCVDCHRATDQGAVQASEPMATDWAQCSHTFVEVNGDTPEGFTAVRCSQCQCPGERNNTTGDVFWPAT